MAMPPARAIQGFADAPVLGWQVVGHYDYPLATGTCQPSTNPFYPYRFCESRFTIFDLRHRVIITGDFSLASIS